MNFKLQIRAIRLVMMFTLLSLYVEAAQYYVVIGTFSEELNARNFTSKARSVFGQVSYSFNEERNLYYVHVMKTQRKDEARNLSLYIKYEIGFKDAWVFTEGDAGQNSIAGAVVATVGEARYSTDKTLRFTNSPIGTSAKAGTEVFTAEKGETSAANTLALSWTTKDAISYVRDIKNIQQFNNLSGVDAGHLFTFIVENNEGKTILSEVKLVDFGKSKKIASFNAGEHVAIRGSKRDLVVTLVCDVLGYGMETRMLNIDHLSRAKDISRNKDGVWEVRFKLKKMALNDVSFLNKTVFYEDAAVLQPSSKKEADELLSLLKKNPGYKIVIHTHCNPGTRRDIALPGKAKDFFDLQNSSVKSGSDRFLTKERAQTLRDYLVANGISKKRIDVMGWGSIDLLVKTTAEDKEINERIEVELVGDKF